jgi:hypothetical protein
VQNVQTIKNVMMAVSDIPFASHVMETSKVPLHLGAKNLVNENIQQF